KEKGKRKKEKGKSGLQDLVWVKWVGTPNGICSPRRASLHPALLSPSRRRPHDSWGGDATETAGRPKRSTPSNACWIQSRAPSSHPLTHTDSRRPGKRKKEKGKRKREKGGSG